MTSYKTSGGKIASPRNFTDVHLPMDAGLSRLLHGAGGKNEKFLNAMSIAASPGHAHRLVELPAALAAAVAADLAALLARARAAGDPAAAALAGVAAQLGVREPEAAPQPPAPR
jgi:hypothetical protein